VGNQAWLVLGTLVSLLSARAGAFAQETGWGKHKKMFAVPTPGKVVMDGKLDDWDRSAELVVYVARAAKEMISGTFAIMYDAEALYVGGEMRDPTPMMNRHAPEIEGNIAWDADSTQFRLVLDASLPYPATDATWEVGKKPDNDQIAHLLLWHYTDRKEANLQIAVSMAYKDPPGSEKFGVIPKDKFRAAYLLSNDKKGYTYEYRIPWSTLGAKRPLKAGDAVAATMQYNWGRPDGMKTAGLTGWGYDLQAWPGFAYQNAGCWGKLIFSEKGNLPRELTEEGMPPEKPLPLTFTYDLPEDSEVTITLFNDRNEAVRVLAAQAKRSAGHVIEKWDGMDDQGQPMAPGTYVWKGLYHQPITMKPVVSLHNSGQPAWKTDDNSGGWGGDHGPPIAVCSAGNDMVMSWTCAEAGWGLIRTDAEGKKRWGICETPHHMASDGERILITPSFDDKSVSVRCFDLKDGRPMLFGNGKPILAPPAGNEAAITGLAYQEGKLYVAFRDANQIAVYDTKQGSLLTTWTVPAPGALAARDGGELVSISDGKLARIKGGEVKVLAGEHLDNPFGVAVDGAGAIYVSNQGKLQNISVFSADGDYQRSIGKPGGRPRIGRYDPLGVLEPSGIAVDAKGRLWVAESIDSPKRISVWNTRTGKLEKEFFGCAHYSAFAWMDPERPDEAYCDGVIWKVDLDKKTAYPFSTAWRQLSPDTPGDLSTHGGGLHMFTAKSGKQYGYGRDGLHSGVLFIRDEDIFKPIVAFIWTKGSPAVAKMYTPHPHGATYPWVDKNDDQTIQTEEIGPEIGKSWFRGFSCADKDLNLWHPQGLIYRPLRIGPDGRPVYDFAKPEKTSFKDVSCSDPDEGSVYTVTDQGGLGFARYQQDGKMLWGYQGVVSWPKALGLPPQKPGTFWGVTVSLGLAGDFTGFATYFGCHHIYTRDGLCVAMLYRDPRLGGALDFDMAASENYNGQLVKPKGMNRYFDLSGDQDGRINEVFGLDTVKRLAGGEYVITEEDNKRAITALREYEAKLASKQKLVIKRGRAALETASAVGKDVKEGMSFHARATYDERNLYVMYNVTSPTELVNGIADPRMIFKGGNLLDIQIAANPGADPKRTTPAPGDVRILVSRRDSKPYAVVFRPRVAGFKGEPIVLKSPTGTESFDAIAVCDKVGLAYQKQANAPLFTAVVSIPLDVLGWKPQAGSKMRMDLGYVFGNETGTKAMARSYWMNNGFSANVLNDVPNESRLTPAEWGEADIE